MFDVAIIGAGVIGAMVARTLSKYDLKICILEKENDVAMGATKANSAIVHAGFDAHEGSLKAKLNVKGSQMMPQICNELGIKFINNGALVLGFDDNDLNSIEALFKRGKQNGVKSLKILNASQIRDIEPNVSDDATCALYAPTSAIICPYELTIAAVGNAMDNGAELKCNFEVRNIVYNDDKYIISSDKEEIQSRFVINCAGLYSDKIANLISDNSFEINARKGEYILLDKDCGALVSHTIFKTPSKMGKGILITPTVDGNLLLGPTSVNIENKEDKSTSVDGLSQIIQTAKQQVKNIPITKSITSFCGLRAVGSTGDFIINSPNPAFINAAGIESPGLTASPAIAEYISEMLRNQGLILKEKSNYNPTRPSMHAFREASIQDKNEIIKQNSAYGKIICRCEGITEGEILNAIRTNPKPHDLDGVKRRTRAQMGRCQGGFCTPYIIELLSKELNIPYEKVTKSGGNSVINVKKIKEVQK